MNQFSCGSYDVAVIVPRFFEEKRRDLVFLVVPLSANAPVVLHNSL